MKHCIAITCVVVLIAVASGVPPSLRSVRAEPRRDRAEVRSAEAGSRTVTVAQAPKAMKSTVMGFWLLSVSFGNILVAALSRFESLTLQNFFWLFAGLMALAAVLFAVFAMFYKYRDYTKG